LRRVHRLALRVFALAMLLGAALMVVGLATGWTVADFHSAVGRQVAAYPPATRLWEVGLTFLLLGFVGREFLRRR